MWRHHPQTSAARRARRDGAIGELRVIRSAFSFSLYDARQHPAAHRRRRRRADGRRLLLRQRLAAARRRAGARSRGEQYIGPSGIDCVFTGVLRFPGDVPRELRLRYVAADRDELEAIGTRGLALPRRPVALPGPVIELRRSDGVERIEIEPEDSYRLELENLSAAIRGERPPLLGRDDALGQARTIDALFRSHRRDARWHSERQIVQSAAGLRPKDDHARAPRSASS